jgi:hypothetical protein
VFDFGKITLGYLWCSCSKSKFIISYLLKLFAHEDGFSFPNTRCHPDPVKLYLVKKIEYIKQMNQIYKSTSIPHATTTEAASSNIPSQLSDGSLHSSAPEPNVLLCPPSPFSFSPRLHRILGRSRYIPAEDEDPKGDEIGVELRNNRSDLVVTPHETSNMVNSGKVDTGIIDGGDHEETHNCCVDNQVPSFLEYSDGESGKVKEMLVLDEDDEEEFDELNPSDYEGLSMSGMLVNTDSGGYYEKNTDDMDVADDTASLDMDVGMSAAAMDDELLEDRTDMLGVEVTEDEIPVEMEVNGETCLFSQAAIAELHLLRENARL